MLEKVFLCLSLIEIVLIPIMLIVSFINQGIGLLVTIVFVLIVIINVVICAKVLK